MNVKTLIAIATLAFSVSAFAQTSGSVSGSGTTGSAADNTGSTIGSGTRTGGDTTMGSGTRTGGDTTMGSGTTAGSSDTTRQPSASDTSAMSPKEICNRFVEYSKSESKNQAQADIDRWILKGQGAGKKLSHQTWLKREISNAKCGDETVAGNHAFVVTKSGDTERFIPFVKQGDTWKLDMQAYKALYRMDSRTPAASE